MKSAIERLHKVLRLPPAERVILGQAWLLFLLVELALRILPFKHLLVLCQKPSLRKREDSVLVEQPSVSRLLWLLEVAGRYTPAQATCLKKALVLSWLLGRRGIRTELRIGVAREHGRLKAHAWLDCDGRTILGHREVERYAPLLRA